MRHIVLATILVGASALVGCGGGKAKQAPNPTPVSDEVFAAAARQAAHSTLVTLPEFPAGWHSSPQDDSSDPELTLSPSCQELNDLGTHGKPTYPGAAAEASSDNFASSTTDLTEDVTSDAGVYRTVAAAKQFQDHMADLEDTCASEFGHALEQEFAAEGVSDSHVRITKAGSPGLGDQSGRYDFSIAATGPGGAIAFVSEYVDVRVGRVYGSLSYSMTGEMTQALADKLTAAFVQRLKLADASLPQ